jgi:hypothetical protein
MSRYSIENIGIPHQVIAAMMEQRLLTNEAVGGGTPENLFLHYHKNDGDEDGTFALTLERDGEVFVITGGLANKTDHKGVRVTCELRGVQHVFTREPIEEKT